MKLFRHLKYLLINIDHLVRVRTNGNTSLDKIAEYSNHIRHDTHKQQKLMKLLEKYDRQDCMNIFLKCFGTSPYASYSFNNDIFTNVHYNHHYLLELLKKKKYPFAYEIMKKFTISNSDVALSSLFNYFITSGDVESLAVYMQTQKITPHMFFCNQFPQIYSYLLPIRYDLLTYSIASSSHVIFHYLISNFSCDLNRKILIKTGGVSLLEFIYWIGNPEFIALCV